MTLRADVAAAIALMGLASCLCRFGGYFLMRYIAITPRVEAWLQAIPIALIGAILGPVAVKGGPAEWLGLATAIGIMKASGNEFLSILAAVGAVAAARTLLA